MRAPPAMLLTRAPRRSRRGVALVMFAMLVFVFLAIAGIAIDVGMASLTQQEMQVAVDTASLEGVRLRDFEAYQDLSNSHRRPMVSQLVRLVFDDDMHPTGGVDESGSMASQPPDDADQMQLGAGPLMSTSGGTGPYAASATMSVAPTRVWDDPVLETNSNPTPGHNRPWGDMVSGTYDPSAAHVEASNYARPDFATAVGTDRWKVLSFLVRMRRTNGTNALDHMSGVSTSGPALPFLFGMGSLMHQAGSGWDPRRDGMTVRATAIAVARPALRASLPPRIPQGGTIMDEGTVSAPMMGLYTDDAGSGRGVSISVHAWTVTFRQQPFHTGFTLDVSQNGELRYPGEPDPVGYFAEAATSVGERITPTAPVMFSPLQKTGYVSIFAPIATPGGGFENRIVGYGFAEVASGAMTLNLKLGIQSGQSQSVAEVTAWVAANGVSAHLGPELSDLSKSQWDAVLLANTRLAYGDPTSAADVALGLTGQVTYDYTRIRPGTLLAPALAR